MKNTDDYVLKLTKHAKQQVKAKEFSLKEIQTMWCDTPTVQPSRSYPGQYRVCGGGVCLVGVPKELNGTLTFVVITCYVDGDLTPPREDQLRTRKGKRFAARYAKGEGRG